MSRSLHKSWDNREERRERGRYKGWTRRVRWYESTTDIRLCFEDPDGVVSKIYKDHPSAEHDWTMFKKGKTVQEFRNEVVH